jgi:hypothetical protein
MNLLWIEDFGGGLIPNDDTLRSFFGDFIDLDEWDNDKSNCIKRPKDLTKFCEENSIHRIWLCRNYFDYAEFKQNYSIIDDVDSVIVDIRLNDGRHVNLTLSIPLLYENKYTDSIKSRSEFHENAGFYIFNNLIHLGFPPEKMCFMTGEKNSFETFAERCAEIYLPRVNVFEKNNHDLENLRTWLKNQESDYIKLRRGIIEGCNYLKNIREDDLQFNQFIRDEDKTIGLIDLFNYIGVLENLLPLQEPTFKKHFYKLFIRTLAHEWESAGPRWLNRQNELFAFSLTMKMLRNWLSHSNLFENLTAQDVAYFFIINTRTMFSFKEKNLLVYEKILLGLFSSISLSVTEFEEVIGTNFNDRKIPLFEKYAQVLQATNNTWQAINFYDALNNLHRNNQYPENPEFFIKGLYRVFWFATSKGYINIPPDHLQNQYNHLRYQFGYFNYHNDSKDYLFELARHVYNRSFQDD